MDIPITQSKDWEKLQNDLHETSFYEQGTGFSFLAILKHTPVGNYLYCPYGPIAKDQKSFNSAIGSLKNLATAHHAIFIRIEPQNIAIKLPKNTKKSTDLNPKETWILDLQGGNDELKQKLPSRLLRYYKGREKQGIHIETSKNPDDIHYLLDLQKALASKKGINTFSEKYLQTELRQPFATLYLVKTSDAWTDDGPGGGPPKLSPILGEEKVRQDPSRSNIIAAGLVFDDATTRYNLQGAQSEQGRKLHATGILTIQLIYDAKSKGLKTFDFWGIAPDGAPADHPWAGFTNFKKTFQGYERQYHGTYDLILKPTKYKSYQLLRKLRRLV
ncbi:peptidoglycan bridge formation glycyltransferase FemA/FemB family protein [Candidatus Saccharibacteria bacterium]|nr:peptidoglycan bridge formation glycyltransferase FemA/FemB family protein [Candidatus Saccharibacteria bacterium]